MVLGMLLLNFSKVTPQDLSQVTLMESLHLSHLSASFYTNFLNSVTFMFSSSLFWGSAVLSPTRSPTLVILPTRISRSTYITVPACWTMENTGWYHPLFVSLRRDKPAEFYRTLLFHFCLIPLFSPTHPPTHPLCLFPSHSSAFSRSCCLLSDTESCRGQLLFCCFGEWVI